MSDQLAMLCVRCGARYLCDYPYCCSWCRLGPGTCPCAQGRQWTRAEEGPAMADARRKVLA